ncbi:MAG: EAL domain-containing protein [Alphaproteobacteria bacterium]|nr:EAL domain-containing protein [Alphaproteobacteria bacterium]
MATLRNPRRLWRPYLLALGLIAALAGVDFLVAKYALVSKDKYEIAIDLSGRQRMLSQQIALYATQFVSQSDGAQRAEARRRLVDAVTLFEKSHRRLVDAGAADAIAAELSSNLKRLYFSGQDSVDAITRHYIGIVNRLLAADPAGAAAAAREINRLGRGDVLRALDKAVLAFEAEAHERLTLISRIATVTFVAIIVVLLAEARWIFWPAQRAVNQALEIFETRTSKQQKANKLLEATLDNIEQGVLVFDANKRLVIWNKQFERIMDCPDGLLREGASVERYIRLNAERGEYGEIDRDDIDAVVRNRMDELNLLDRRAVEPFRYTRQRSNGRIIEIVGNPMPGGGLVTTCMDITKQEEARQEIERLAWTDELTGLLNRNSLRSKLGKSSDGTSVEPPEFALLLINLTRFKPINETYGHAAGDKVLIETARRIKRALTADDHAFRLGGDEFAAIIYFQEDRGPVFDCTSKLLEDIQGPIAFDGREVTISANIGVAFFPENDTQGAELVRKADIALDEAKAERRASFRIYDALVDHKAQNQRQMEDDLRGAVQRGEFELYVQPQYCATGDEIIGGETLLRWNHPDRGLIPPGDFIEIVEGSDLVFSVGTWVLRDAWRLAQLWTTDRDQGQFTLAANVSGRQFFDTGFLDLLSELTHTQPDLASRVELEVTEEVLIGHMDEASQILNMISEMGFSISIDDFGTGYSSIAYLHKLPVQKIKIDKSFLENFRPNTHSATIIQAIIDLGHDLGAKVIAEGIETEEQMQFLRACGCDEFQGFYFAKPMPARDFGKLLQSGSRFTRKSA